MLWVDLFDIVDDVIVQRLAEQFVRATQQSEAQLEQSCCRNETLTTQHHQRLTERLKHGMNVRTFLDHTTQWRKIKSPYMKITISEKYVNIFSPNVAYFCSIQLCTDFVALCCTYLMYAKLTETQLSRTNFPTEQKEWLSKHCPLCPDFTDKDSWPPNSPDLNPLNYHVWGAMLEKFQELNFSILNAFKRSIVPIDFSLFLKCVTD